MTGLGNLIAIVRALLRDGLFRACAGFAPAEAVPLAAFACAHASVGAATACLISFLLDTAAAIGQHPPEHMQLQCLRAVVTFLQGVPCAAPTSPRPPLHWRAFSFLTRPP